MDLGTIVFYRNEKEFDAILDHAKIKAQSLSIEDAQFKEFYGYSRQSVFHILYQSDKMWGFLASKINRKNGATAWKVINSDNKVSIIEDSQIYFALTMDDFTYTHWAEMNDKNTVSESPHSKRIIKKPSISSIKNAKVVKTAFLPKSKMLYQIVSLAKGNPLYPSSNPFNSQWEHYDPYSPAKNPYHKYISTNPTQQGYWTTESTFHAVPFLRDNINPSTFTVVRKAKTPTNELRMFINYPNGIPISIA